MLLEMQSARRIEFVTDAKFWAWTLAVLAALIAGITLFALKPVTNLYYSSDQLTSAVPDRIDYGLYGPEVDAGGQAFRWFNPRARLVFPITSNHPMSITFRLRNAKVAGAPVSAVTEIFLNNISIGKVEPTAEFQDYTFNLVPPYLHKKRLEFRLETNQVWVPPNDSRRLANMIQSVSIDGRETWLPIQKTSRVWLLWLLPVLALPLAGLVWAARTRRSSRANYGAIFLAAGLSAIMLLWLFLLARVGYSGDVNLIVYWVWVAGAAFLALFFGWLAFDGLGWGQPAAPTLRQHLTKRLTPWVVARPQLAALIGLVLVNFVVTGVFYAKIGLESRDLQPIARYWDGPEYIFIAHGFYDKNEPLLAAPDFGEHAENYYAAHFPGFPLVVRAAWYIVGWKAAMPVVNFIVTCLFAFVFWKLLRDFKYTPYPFWVTCVGLVLPLRWLIYHSVGASEPLFLLCEVLSLYLFKKERYWLAALVGAAALFVRPPGVFLWVGFMLFIAWEAGLKMYQTGKLDLRYINWKAVWPLSIIPLTLLLVFGIYAWRYGDFLAYFHIDDDDKHVQWLPLPTLATGQDGVTGFFYYYLIQVAGLVLLWKQKRFDVFWVGFAAFAYTLTLLHNDVLRYSLPAFPLVVLIPFSSYLSGKAARWLAIPVLVGVYFYSWGAFNSNLAGPDTWQLMESILGQ